MSFLPIFDRPNSIGEINCFLRRMVLQNGNSLLTGAESRVTLSDDQLESDFGVVYKTREMSSSVLITEFTNPRRQRQLHRNVAFVSEL